MQFEFPSLPQSRFSKCDNLPHLRDMIRKQLIDVGLDRKCKYRVSYRSQKFILAKCNVCKAFLRYKLNASQDEHIYTLIKYDSHHEHPALQEDSSKKERVLHYLRNLPSQVTPASMRQHIMKQFCVSQFTFYAALKQMQSNNRGVSFKILLPYLEERGYIIFDPFPIEKVKFFPEFCLYISHSMKRAYINYGRFIGIDFTFNLIKQRPYVPEEELGQQGGRNKKKPKQWITGLITGLDSARRLQVYGLAFCYSQSADNIQKILQNFIDVMGRQPQTIISDAGLGIQEGIKRLKQNGIFNGVHLLDAYHVMANLKVSYQHTETLRKLYLAPDQQEYYDIYQSQIVHMAPSDQQKLAKFETLSNRFCMSKIPITFVGLGCSTCMCQKTNDIIKSCIPNQTNFSEVFTKLDKLADRINQQQPLITYETYQIENILTIPEIKQIKKVLNRYVFQRFVRQVLKCVSLEYRDCKNMCVEQDSKWLCKCKFQQKTGLPCRHISKIIITLKRQFLKQIDEYWILSNKQDIKKVRQTFKNKGIKKQKRGRPRKSRRNMKK